MSKESPAAEKGIATEELPKAKIKKTRWPFPIIWLVPIAAAIFAGYLFYNQYKEFGPKITITFSDSSDVKIGQTPVECRGVQIGQVSGLKLSDDFREVQLQVRLRQSARAFAEKGALYWIVRPEVGNGSISGLGTVFSGPYIEALPGHGEEIEKFTGLERAPAEAGDQALKLVLRTTELGYIKPASPIYFRGIQVGAVEGYQLSRDASLVEIHASIRHAYAKLVTADSMFWNVSGADVSGGLFSGIDVRIESLQSLLGGGLAFATPSNDTPPAKDGAQFTLHDKPKKEWLEWTPNAQLPAGKNQPADQSDGEQGDQILLRSGKIQGEKVPPR